MTEVTEEQRIALVEFIAHLTMEDWPGVARTLVSLGFLPEGLPSSAPGEPFQMAPILEQVLGQLVKGGGLGNGGLNFTSLTLELQGVASEYQMVVPAYFALILRAFSTIEGIALKVDPSYAIVHECMPYLSRRLLTDNNPRMRAALKHLLYGDKQRVDVDRLARMVSAFSSFTTAGQSTAAGPTFSAAYGERVKGRPAGGGADDDSEPVVSDAMREVLRVVFSKDGSYAQELIVEELVAAADAMSREALGEAVRMVLDSSATLAALRSIEALGPLRAMFLPLPLPQEMLAGWAPAVRLTAEDREALSTLRTLLDLMAPGAGGVGAAAASGRRAVRLAGELMPLMPEILPGVQATAEMFVRQLVRRMAMRLAADLEPRNQLAAAPYRGMLPSGAGSGATAADLSRR